MIGLHAAWGGGWYFRRQGAWGGVRHGAAGGILGGRVHGAACGMGRQGAWSGVRHGAASSMEVSETENPHQSPSLFHVHPINIQI